MISYGKHSISEDDIRAVVEVLHSDFLTQGSVVSEFENNLARYCGVKFATAVSNGTAALHLAYIAVGLKQNDIVWTSPNTFVATANAALYCRATVDFVDIDPQTYNISISSLKEKLIQAKKDNKLPKLVVPVHFSGQSCEMKDIWLLSKEYGFKIVEDASHALGGEYLGGKIGSCDYSHMTVFSFHPVKMITTAEGGAILTNDIKLNEKVALLRSHGITKNKSKFINQSDGDWQYEQHDLGFNYRMNDMQAALGVSQLKRLNCFVEKRQEIADYYLKNLKNVILPYQHSDSSSSWHLFVIQTEHRNSVYTKLKEHGVMTQIHYIPVYEQPFFNQKKLYQTNLYYKRCISLPIYVDLSRKNQEKVINLLKNI